MKALIVDDSKLNLMVAQKILEKIGFSVDTVLSGEECLEKIKNNSYNIIFMDIMMPNMDGIETYNCLRKVNGFNTPVVALTADVDNTRNDYINKYGFNEYLSKPLKIDELNQVLKNLKLN